MMRTKLGMRKIFFAVGLLGLGIVPVATSAPTVGAATFTKGSWYCFGEKATITFSAERERRTFWGTDDLLQQHRYFKFVGTPGKDVIVTTTGHDLVEEVEPGDRVCTREGNDVIRPSTKILPDGRAWVKVDAGDGDDIVAADTCEADDDPAAPDPGASYGTLEVHAGPGADWICGGAGDDSLFSDEGTRVFYAEERHSSGYGDELYCSAGVDKAHGSGAFPDGTCELHPNAKPYRPAAEFRKK